MFSSIDICVLKSTPYNTNKEMFSVSEIFLLKCLLVLETILAFLSFFYYLKINYS